MEKIPYTNEATTLNTQMSVAWMKIWSEIEIWLPRGINFCPNEYGDHSSWRSRNAIWFHECTDIPKKISRMRQVKGENDSASAPSKWMPIIEREILPSHTTTLREKEINNAPPCSAWVSPGAHRRPINGYNGQIPPSIVGIIMLLNVSCVVNGTRSH